MLEGSRRLVGSVVSGDAPYEETTFVWVVTRMDTSKSGWTPYVYYTTLYSTPRYTIFRRIKVTRPSFCGGYHPALTLSGIPTFTFIVSLTL